MATEVEVKAKYNELINSYYDFKPILASLYTRNGNRYVEGIANEIRALNDHIARCYRKDISINTVYDELCKAEGHLKRLTFDSFKQLNIIFHDYLESYEKQYFGQHWVLLDNGNFWKNYCKNRNAVIFNIETAKKNESRDYDIAINCYQDAYVGQENVYTLIQDNEKHLKQGFFDKIKFLFSSTKNWVLTTFLLAVIPALLWEFFKNAPMLFGEFWKWLIDILHEIGVNLTEI